MKICHLTSVHPYMDTRIFIKECRSLSEIKGFSVHFVAPDAPTTKKDGVNIHGVKKEAGGRFNRMRKTTKNVLHKALEIDADVYHFHDPELIPIGLKLKKKRKKVIYDIHEDVPRQILSKHWIPKPLRRMISFSFERYENKAVKNFDGLVTATPFINKRFERLHSNAININNFPLLDELHLPHVDWEKKEKSVCYVGGLVKNRGIYEMVEALNHTDTQMLLAGTFGNTKDYEEVQQKSSWNKVHYLGFLDRDGVKNTFQKSMAGLVVLHPTMNYIDALPVKMFEYMAAGLPVIASDFSLWKEIIESNNCGICVDPLKPEEIGKAIQWLVDHPEEAKQMGENGRRAVEEKYNWEKESEKLLSLYKKLEKELQK